MLPVFRTITQVRQELHDTVTLELDAGAVGARGLAPFGAFEAGQFNMLYTFGNGEVPISISGDPAHRAKLVHTIRTVGAVTQALSRLQKGDSVGVRGPYGVGWPLRMIEGKDVIMVAGGIGLAPLRPAIYRLLANRERYGRVAVLYGARRPADLLYRVELEHWRARLDCDVRVTVDGAAADWKGEVGVVAGLVAAVGFNPQNAVALICCPEIMMRFTVNELKRLGLPDEAIYISMERKMQCGIGLCGHCQFGPTFVCKDGPVFRYDRVKKLLDLRGA